jgi:hypothetical protein
VNLYIVTVIDRGTEVEFETEAANVTDAKRNARQFFGTSAKLVSVSFGDPLDGSPPVRVSATYRIETAYEPSGVADLNPWIARVYRLSDDERVTFAWGESEALVIEDARAWILRYESTPEAFTGRTVHVDDQGRDAEAPQSVRVP